MTDFIDSPLEVHEAVRGHLGAFQKTCQGVRDLAEARDRRRKPGPIILIKCVISKANVATLDQMVPLAHELGRILKVQHTIFHSIANVKHHNQAFSPCFATAQGLDLAPPVPRGRIL